MSTPDEDTLCVHVYIMCSASHRCEFHMKACVFTPVNNLRMGVFGAYVKIHCTSHRERGLLRPVKIFLFKLVFGFSCVNGWSDTEPA